MTIDYEKELEAIANDGYQAYLDGKSIMSNPYKVVQLKDAWESGYMDAEMCDEPLNEPDFYEECGDFYNFDDLYEIEEEDMPIC